jgi:hypothetical protein
LSSSASSCCKAAVVSGLELMGPRIYPGPCTSILTTADRKGSFCPDVVNAHHSSDSSRVWYYHGQILAQRYRSNRRSGWKFLRS